MFIDFVDVFWTSYVRSILSLVSRVESEQALYKDMLQRSETTKMRRFAKIVNSF